MKRIEKGGDIFIMVLDGKSAVWFEACHCMIEAGPGFCFSQVFTYTQEMH